MLPNPQPYCADLSDPRRQNRNRLHALRDIIMINLCGKPPSPSGRVIPCYYNLPDRGQRLDRMLAQGHAWSTGNSESLQLDDRTDYAARVLQPLLPTLRQQVTDPRQQQWLERLAHWQGNYPQDSLEATLFNQFFYELARATLHDELGNALFDNLLGGRVLDTAMPKLVADERSPGWDNRDTPAREGRAETVLNAWQAAIDHLRSALGDDPQDWQGGKVHRLTQTHPLGTQAVLGLLYNVGPFEVGGSHEVPNNFSAPRGPAPWSVSYGPSIRRIIDLGAPADAWARCPWARVACYSTAITRTRPGRSWRAATRPCTCPKAMWPGTPKAGSSCTRRTEVEGVKPRSSLMAD